MKQKTSKSTHQNKYTSNQVNQPNQLPCSTMEGRVRKSNRDSQSNEKIHSNTVQNINTYMDFQATLGHFNTAHHTMSNYSISSFIQ